MFSDLIDWFLGRGSDRRQYKRRPGAFHLWWQPPQADGEPQPGIGLELSPNGLMFLVPDTLPSNEYSLILRLNDVKMPVRVRTARSDQVEHDGKPMNRYMGEFVGIAADNWDMLARYVNDDQETSQDDAYRLLPPPIQQKIVAKLVEQNKLEEPPPGQTPLLKIFYGGLVNQPGEPPLHRVNVHSRIQVEDELMAYDTRFLAGEDGEIELA